MSVFRNLLMQSTGWLGKPSDWSDIRKDCPANSIALYAGHTNDYVFETKQGDITYEKVGNPTIVDGVISNFSDNDYATFSQPFRPGNKPWKVKVDFKTTDDWGLYRGILSKEGAACFVIAFRADKYIEVTLSSNGTSLDIGFFNTTYALEDYTEYSIVVEFTGSSYIALIRKAGENYKPIGPGIIQSSTPIFDNDQPLNIGQGRLLNNNFRGSINLNNTYIEIDNQMWYGSETRMVAANPNIYLQSSGTQYIDVGLKPTANTDIEIKAKGISGREMWIGSRTSSLQNEFLININSSNNTYRFGYGNNARHQENATNITTQKRQLKLEHGGNCYIDNELVASNIGTFSGNNFNIFLFAMNSGGTPSTGYMTGIIYSCKIWENNILVRHLVPVPSGLVIGSFTCPSNGMFDIVYQDFYANAGTDNFTYGRADTSAYDNLGFTATCVGGYKVFIDGTQYGSTYASGSTCNITWSTSGITTGDDITTPSALKAHKIWIKPATEGNNITAFHCERVAASGAEQQGILWEHFNLSNVINLYTLNCAGSLGSYTYANPQLMACTAKNNTINCSSLGYAFLRCPNLEYAPIFKKEDGTCNIAMAFSTCEKLPMANLELAASTDASYAFYSCKSLKKFPSKLNLASVSTANIFLYNAANLQDTIIDFSQSNNLKIVGTYSNSASFANGIKGLRVSNEAPFDGAAPQINVSYTGMDRDAIVTLFNDLPTVSGGQIINVTYTTGAADLTDDDKAIATDKGWTIAL